MLPKLRNSYNRRSISNAVWVFALFSIVLLFRACLWIGGTFTMIHGGVNETILNGNESAKAIDNSSMIGIKPNTDQGKWLRQQSSKAVDRLVKRECLWLFLVLDVIILMLKFSLFHSCFFNS